MGQAAAMRVADHLRALLAKQDQVRMIFAAAPSQLDMLAQLMSAPGIDWSRVVAFHMDEYVGLAPDADQRFAKWLDAEIFSKLPFAETHSILPEPDAHAAAAAYAAALNEAPIDIVCLGIGVNGHIAFNDPPVADFNDPLDVKQVELDDICRQQQVDDECFASFDDVPTHALTLTIPRLLRTNAMFCVVPGAQKRDAVIGTLSGPVSTDCPASILRTHNNCTLFLDNESAP